MSLVLQRPLEEFVLVGSKLVKGLNYYYSAVKLPIPTPSPPKMLHLLNAPLSLKGGRGD